VIFTLGERRVELRGKEHFIAPNATLIGSIILEECASIWFNTILRGDNEPIVIGAGSNIQDSCVLHTDEGILLTVGQWVTVGHMVMLHGCTIGDNTLIGIKSVILNRAKIGNNCLIGANTLIPEDKEIPDNSLVMGSPGKIVRELKPEQIARIRRSAEHYVENMRRYLRLLKADERYAG
jgi:carbonic anhydrase/acetyltransferase-like protein (isoleucine patch superfamily)